MQTFQLKNIHVESDYMKYFQVESDYMKYFQVESDYLEYFWWKEHYTVHTVLEAKVKAFCRLCEKLNRQKTFNGGYHKPVTSENHRERTGGCDKYQDFVSWFKKVQSLTHILNALECTKGRL